MKIKITSTSFTLALPIAASKSSSTSLATKVDSKHNVKKFAEKHRRLSSPSSIGDQFIANERKALPDVGVLQRRAQRSNSNIPSLFNKHRRKRFLQDSIASEEVETCLKPDTCEPKLCACVANGGGAYECAHELHAVCQGLTSTERNFDGTTENWTIDGCVDEQRVEYYTNVYCHFAGCLANGGTYTQCSCDHFYTPYCEFYGEYTESETVQLYCERAKCCSAAEDDVGREVCFLEGTTFGQELSEDPLDQSQFAAPPGSVSNVFNSADSSAEPKQAVPNQGLLYQAPSQAEIQVTENGAVTSASIESFGISLISTFALISAILFNIC